MRPLRISAISFLNTAPLMWEFEHDPPAELTDNFEIEYTVPSKCAKALAAGTADIGIIPVFTYAEIPDLVVVPDVAIASRGAVRSILLISKKPLEETKTVAVDTSSRTSVALTQVLLTKWYGGKRELVPMDPDVTAMLHRCDAALLIGDPALVISENPAVLDNAGGNGELYVFDLAELWVEKTGKPFVFAVWAVREQALRECNPGLDVAEIFQRSRDCGLLAANVTTIAREWAPKLELSEQTIFEYLTNNIHYKLDAACMEGLGIFFDYSKECGLIERVPELKFV
jgi:chorismate dehydratase